MHPAPSVIIFTTFSGLGLGLLFWLGISPDPHGGWVGFTFFFIAFALSCGGLAASTFHLGHPERALKAFTQWRSSWLSREAWSAAGALAVMGLYAFFWVILGIHIAPLGWLGALLCLATVGTTSMIYTQLKTVPRWNHWSTPALFFALSLGGGALLAGYINTAVFLIALSGAVQAYWFWQGDQRFSDSGTDLGTATGLGSRGKVRAFEPPHTGTNYLLTEFVYVVGRKHGDKLRLISLALSTVLPLLLLLTNPGHLLAVIAVVSHVAGVVVSRWLFFAQAEHVVGLYYGKR
ncbi:dimethyl sulfoxide reductase anchor subunit [Tropicibacter sp. R15_0]|uniref:dimethyl sulfoxide reductase anchor subunit family protein n=1 Tax=Tropicibacter sp. R15_0 TaxID=2821101 RepID=UPI001AD9F101|nr:DmsC/YnfH family molybdoenzyme membrane anchor subunit [Tropicibacter sp. R15_0]MBO9464079.1 dimethyl sulfoxide reductase anchor subunit [Tropicibacter sp. R15_0]